MEAGRFLGLFSSLLFPSTCDACDFFDSDFFDTGRAPPERQSMSKCSLHETRTRPSHPRGHGRLVALSLTGKVPVPSGSGQIRLKRAFLP